MDKWAGKIAVVTGASAGVGAAVAEQLVQEGMTVVGVARRVEKVQELQSQVSGAPGKLYALQGDVSREEDIKNIFSYVKKEFGTIHVLVNNAGFMVAGTIIDGNPSDWQRTLDVNVVGVATCAKEAINLMRETGVTDGHIINVNSWAGHRVPPAANPFYNIYPSSKFAVTALSEVLRMEIQSLGSKIRVTNLCPGYIKTEFEHVAAKDSPEYQAKIKNYLAKAVALQADDLAEAVKYILAAPSHVQVHELVLAAI